LVTRPDGTVAYRDRLWSKAVEYLEAEEQTRYLVRGDEGAWLIEMTSISEEEEHELWPR
jgi:hypothetical protein